MAQGTSILPAGRRLQFPVRNALYPTVPAVTFGGFGFVTKFNPDATQIHVLDLFPARVDRIAVDSAGAAYVSGTAFARGFPATPGLPDGGIGGIAPMIFGGVPDEDRSGWRSHRILDRHLGAAKELRRGE